MSGAAVSLCLSVCLSVCLVDRLCIMHAHVRPRRARLLPARGEIALIIRLAFLVRASRSIIVRCGRVRGLQT